MNLPKRIIIHHSATADSKTLSWGAIRRYHVHTLGWLDIGYHAGIELVGDELECVYGRPATMVGAHTAGHNRDTLGFCFVGNYDAAAPGPEMLSVAVRRVLAPWAQQFDIPVEAVLPHRDFAHKSCPGAQFEIEALRDMITAARSGQ